MQNLQQAQRRIRLLFQLVGTAVALGWVPGNAAKLITMAIIWLIGFGYISWRELLVMFAINGLFLVMNLGALRQGVFQFSYPDVLGLPVYEYFMWGFYVLHTFRFWQLPHPRGSLVRALIMAVLFALPFSTIADAGLLFLATAGVLAASFALFHEPADFAYAGYMVVVGALIEYVGVGTGQWHYPSPPYGGVPFWFVTMWCGVGLFSRRLFLPLFCAGGRRL